ncbi:TPA: hypothetical protein ENS27_11265, partial [bacterium]|nr:hypothetical protein [bacterium]
MSENWYSQTMRKIHFDMHTPENVENVGKDFDPQAFASAIKKTGAQAVCFFARCAYGWSYYPTQVGLPHPHLMRDVFGDGVKAMKESGIRVISYVAIDNIPKPLAEKHPEWCSRKSDGSIRAGHGTGTMACPSIFINEMLIPQFIEITKLYQVDGFFLDGVYQYFGNVCYCETCKQSYGKDIPQEPNDPNWRAFRHWQVQNIWSNLGKAADEVKRVNPDCLMGVNWLSSIRWSVPPPESMGYLTGDPPLHNGTFETAFNLSAWAWRDKPSDLMNERMLHHWQDFTCRTPETIETEYATALAGGGKLFIGDLLKPVDVKPDPEIMKLHRKCFDFIISREESTENAKLLSDIAILSSPETIRGANWSVDETPLRGTYLALIEGGLTADILYDADIKDNISRYKALIIAEQQFIGRNSAISIMDFVKSGGGLIVIGAIPKIVDPDEPDSSADITVFEEIIGLKYQGDYPYNLGYLLLRGTKAEGFWRDGDDFLPPIPVHGKSIKTSVINAEILAPFTAPGQTYQIGAMPYGETLESPALSQNKYGKGNVLFCSLPIASDYWRRGNPGAKYIVQKMVRRVISELAIERIGSSSVQVYVSKCDGKTIIHLVSYQPDRRTGFPQVVESPSAVTGIIVKLTDKREPTSIYMKPENRILEVKREGKYLIVQVP